jgi:hypothetical protein
LAIRCWEKRRFLLTKDSIFIAFVDEETFRDKIPLAEIENIENSDLDIFKEKLYDPNSTSGSLKSPSSLFTARHVEEVSTHSSASVLKVYTQQIGYNSGRIYYFQPLVDGPENLKNELINNASVARRKAEGKTRFQNSQESVRKLINSRPSSVVTGVLLITVRLPSC